MKPDNLVLEGDCVEVMAGLEPESVDAIVTDPPYGLEFMGKEWDKLNPLGSGGRGSSGGLFAGATGRAHGESMRRHDFRGYGAWHSRWAEAAYRVAKPSAYLLAFGGTRTVHRMTVALEDAGWIIRDMLVWAYACLSDDTEILTEEGWVRYNSPNVGQLAAAFDPESGEIRWERIEAVHQYDHGGPMAEVGPQLVTLNHRVVLDAATARVPRLPDMWHDVYSPVGMGQEGESVVLLPTMQRRRSAAGPEVQDWDAGRLDGGVATLSVGEDDRTAQSGLEGRRHRIQEAWELLGSPLPSSAGLGSADGSERWLRHGTSAPDRGSLRLSPLQDRVRQPREPRPDRQPAREPNALAEQPDAQALRVGQVPGGDGEPDPVRLVDYVGTVWCITVPSGAFVARRNGVVFVTGNSGFPKSKASLKPAWEPIVLARKPGPLRQLAIDECRIPAPEGLTNGGVNAAPPQPMGRVAGVPDIGRSVEAPAGRWPANVILTDPIFDGDTEGVVGGGEAVGFRGQNDLRETPSNYFGADKHPGFREGYGDSGTYSRFFLVPKSDRTDREPVIGIGGEAKSGGRVNVHPTQTVKPTELMRHLVRLVTPPGGLVLDPFLGSGTTAIACELEGFSWLGIEKEPEYVAIANARLNGTQRGMGLSA